MATRIAIDGRYITDRFHGIGRVAYELVDALAHVAEDETFVVFLDPRAPNDRFDMERLAAHPRVEIRHVRLPLLVPTGHLVWPVLLRSARIDLFHSPYVVGPVLGPVPTVVTVHDLIIEQFPAYAPHRLLRGAFELTARASLRHAAAVLAVSEATRTDLERWYPGTRSKTVVVPNGVSPTFRPITDATVLAEVRARYRLPSRFVLAVGAGRPHKNFEVLVEAAAGLSAGDDLAIVLVSTPDRRFPDVVGRQIEDRGLAGRLLRLPTVPEGDLPALYALAEALLFPSLVEGFGLPMVEAMAVGTPVIASNASVMPEVGGDAALYFDPHDAAMLVTQIRSVVTDPALRATLSTRGRERARQFTWERAARLTLETYRTILARR